MGVRIAGLNDSSLGVVDSSSGIACSDGVVDKGEPDLDLAIEEAVGEGGLGLLDGVTGLGRAIDCGIVDLKGELGRDETGVSLVPIKKFKSNSIAALFGAESSLNALFKLSWLISFLLLALLAKVGECGRL